MGFSEKSTSSIKKIKKAICYQAVNQNAEDFTHQISFKIKEKCWLNIKLSSSVKL
jgi:hypothetical protein